MALGKYYFRICDNCGVTGPAEYTTARANSSAKKRGFRKAVYDIDRHGRKRYSDRCIHCPDPTIDDRSQ